MDLIPAAFLLAAVILAWAGAVDWRPRSTASALLLVGCYLATTVAALAALAVALTDP